jgi:hypothetical protein
MAKLSTALPVEHGLVLERKFPVIEALPHTHEDEEPNRIIGELQTYVHTTRMVP